MPFMCTALVSAMLSRPFHHHSQRFSTRFRRYSPPPSLVRVPSGSSPGKLPPINNRPLPSPIFRAEGDGL